MKEMRGMCPFCGEERELSEREYCKGKNSIYDVAEKWRGIPLQYPALGYVEPEEDEEMDRRRE